MLHAIKQCVEFGCRFVLETPGNRYRTIQDEAGHASAPAGVAQFAPVDDPQRGPSPQCAEAPHCFGSALLLRIRYRDQTRDRPTAASDHHFLTCLNPIQQFGEMRLGLKGADLRHCYQPDYSTSLLA
jgi:hypothetical protein